MTADGSAAAGAGLAVPDVPDGPASARIRDALAAVPWGWLTGAVRSAWEIDLSRTRVRVDVDRLLDVQAGAMADFLGWRTHRHGTVAVDLRRLDVLLRASGLDAGLATCLTASGGPLADHAGTRRAKVAARRAAGDELWTAAAAHPALLRHPQLMPWLADERAAGRLPAEPRVRARALGDALAVLAVLPDPGTGLGRLASRVLGGAHALDGGPVPAAVLRAAGWITGQPRTAPTAAERRRLWASLGVALDTVSSTVLVLGLTLPGTTPLAAGLAVHAAAGLPVRITLGQLAQHLDGAGVGGARRVRVCENPSVVEEAADRLGPTCAPLVCVEGRPSVAASRLLSALAAAGTNLGYHGDFDWPGLEIANGAVALGARPWRMSTADYRAAVSTATVALPRLPDRGGTTAAWDGDLAGVMEVVGRQVEEEHVLPDLLADLG